MMETVMFNPIYIPLETKSKLVAYHTQNLENIEKEGYTSFDDWCTELILEAYYGYWDLLPSARASELRHSNGSETQ